jgi:autotransporter-associated beta strand protein
MKPRILSTARLFFPLAAAIAALLAAQSASAAPYYWDGTSASWNTVANWSTASGADTPDPLALPGAADDAVFNITTVNGAETITLDADQAVQSMTFNNTDTTTLTGGGTARTLTLGTGGITMAATAGAVTLGDGTPGNNVLLSLATGAQTWTNNSAAAFTINNTAATFTRATRATLTFNQASTGTFAIDTTELPLVNSIVGPWAHFGTGANQRYAVSGAAVTGFAGTNQANVNNMTSATVNYVYTAAASTTAGAANLAANTIRTSLANTISLSSTSTGNVFDLTLNGILATGSSGTFTISRSVNSATRGLQIGSTGELVIAGQQAVTISAAIFGVGKGVIYSGSNILTLSGANIYTGTTTNSAGTLNLGNSLALQNSPLDTTGSITGTGTVGLKTTATALTLGGLTGNKDLSTVFRTDSTGGPSGTTALGGYGGVTALTLNPGTGAVPSYSGIIADGAVGMTLNKSGAGNQFLSGTNTYTGATTVSAGILTIDHNSALGTIAGNTTVTGTATLRLANGIVVTGETVLISGTGDSNGALQAAAGVAAEWAGPVQLAASGTGVGAGIGGSLKISGGIIDEVGTDLTIAAGDGGAGEVIISAASGTNTYSGLTMIVRGTLKLGAENTLPTGTTLDVDSATATEDSIFDLKGFNQTIGGLQRTDSGGSGGAIITNSGATDNTLTINQSVTTSFSGVIENGATHKTLIVKDGSGDLTLSGTNTYTGATTVSAGTLTLGASDVLEDTTAVSIGSATLAVGAGFTDTVGTLDATGAAIIALGSNTSTLAFAASNGIDWSGNTLTLTGDFVSGASVRFGTTNTGLTSTQLALISATGFTGFGLNSNGYLTATPAGGYSAWQTANSTAQTIDLDHDNDGVSNGVEYFLGGNTDTTGFTALPGVDNAAGVFSVTWTKAATGYTGTYGTDFVVETSATLNGAWATELADPTPGFTVTFPSATEVKYTFPAGTTNFARLKVTGP